MTVKDTRDSEIFTQKTKLTQNPLMNNKYLNSYAINEMSIFAEVETVQTDEPIRRRNQL
jgi:hypothetical protein